MSLASAETNDGSGLIGEGITRPWATPIPRRINRARILTGKRLTTIVMLILVAVAIIVIASPADETSARPGRTGGDCHRGSGGCHGATPVSFISVSGFPTSGYVPGQTYTVTVSIADSNGVLGQNSIDFIVSAGTLTAIDTTVAVVSALEVVSQAFTISSWSFNWTAPTSGSVTADAWGVYGSGNGRLDYYEHVVLNTIDIPEFGFLIVPIAGAVGMLLLARKATRKV